MIVSETQKPPVGGMGGSIHDWERGTDPFYADVLPPEFYWSGTQGEPQSGWIALDFWGTQIGWCADGTEIDEPKQRSW